MAKYLIVFSSRNNMSEIFTYSNRFRFIVKWYAKFLIKCGFRAVVMLKLNQ